MQQQRSAATIADPCQWGNKHNQTCHNNDTYGSHPCVSIDSLARCFRTKVFMFIYWCSRLVRFDSNTMHSTCRMQLSLVKCCEIASLYPRSKLRIGRTHSGSSPSGHVMGSALPVLSSQVHSGVLGGDGPGPGVGVTPAQLPVKST